MRHGLGYDDWLGYLDNDLDAAASARVREHLGRCAECRETWRDLLAATAALREAAAGWREEFALSPAVIAQARDRVMARVRAQDDPLRLEAVAGGELTLRRLRRLQALVAPVCGPHTAFCLIVTAVRRTPIPGTEHSAWTAFLEELTDLTSAFCGRSTARLVWEIGATLP